MMETNQCWHEDISRYVFMILQKKWLLSSITVQFLLKRYLLGRNAHVDSLHYDLCQSPLTGNTFHTYLMVLVYFLLLEQTDTNFVI